MPELSDKLKIPMPLGTEKVNRENFLEILNAIEKNAASEAQADKPFFLKSASYDLANNRIELTISPGRAEFINSSNAIIMVDIPEDTTYYITDPAIETTYYLFLQSDGNFSHNTTGIIAAGSIVLWSVGTGQQVEELTSTERRAQISGVATAVMSHLAETSSHSATSAATANRIVLRDAAGRAKVAAPSATDDIAIRQTVDDHANDATHHIRYADASGTNDKTITVSPAPASYTAGLPIAFRNVTANTGAVTLNINSLGARTVLRANGEALESGDLAANSVYTVRFNGTNFILQGEGGGLVHVDFTNYATQTYPFLIRSTPTELSAARHSLTATTVGTNALFGGGDTGSASAVVDAYNTSLVRSTPTALSAARHSLTATTVGTNALFGGGATGAVSAVVDAYNTSLVRSTPTALSAARSHLTATTVGTNALFGGGDTGSASAVVDAYNTSLVRSTPTALSAARHSLTATTVGTNALFGGGATGAVSAVVDAYNTSLVRSTPTALSAARSHLTATTVGTNALFGGGDTGSASAVVDAYNTSLVRSTPTALSAARHSLTATTVGTNALFGGGVNAMGAANAVVDAYNTSLVRSTPTALSAARSNLTATTVGTNALFCGGSPISTVVDAYQSDVVTYIPVTAGSRYRFTEENEQTAATSTTLIYVQRVTGYVKYKRGTIV
jgi:hypothetical protein